MTEIETERLGELDRSRNAWQLRFVRTLPHPAERVWRAVTDPDELAAWFPTTIDGDRAEGAPLTFRFRNGEGPAFEGSITAFDPPRLIAFWWGGDLVRIRLEELAAGSAAATRLTLEATLDAQGKAARDSAGWHVCLDRLQALLADLTGDDGNGTDWRALHERYRVLFGPEAATIGPPAGHA